MAASGRNRAERSGPKMLAQHGTVRLVSACKRHDRNSSGRRYPAYFCPTWVADQGNPSYARHIPRRSNHVAPQAFDLCYFPINVIDMNVGEPAIRYISAALIVGQNPAHGRFRSKADPVGAACRHIFRLERPSDGRGVEANSLLGIARLQLEPVEFSMLSHDRYIHQYLPISVNRRRIRAIVDSRRTDWDRKVSFRNRPVCNPSCGTPFLSGVTSQQRQ